MLIHKIITSVDYNKWLKIIKAINQNSLKVPKVVETTNKKMILLK